jgi:hypothetical protein
MEGRRHVCLLISAWGGVSSSLARALLCWHQICSPEKIKMIHSTKHSKRFENISIFVDAFSIQFYTK